MNRVLFCNIAWMNNYKGNVKEDVPMNGGSWVRKTADGAEKFNFLAQKDKVYGFVETKWRKDKETGDRKAQQIHIERIEKSASNSESIDNVLVIFCATNKEDGNVIVGWYENATILRHRKIFQNILGEEQGTNIYTDIGNAYLIPADERMFNVPRAKKEKYGFGQSNLWYAEGEKGQEFVEKVVKYITSMKNMKGDRLKV